MERKFELYSDTNCEMEGEVYLTKDERREEASEEMGWMIMGTVYRVERREREERNVIGCLIY